MSREKSSPSVLTPSQVAVLFAVSAETVSGWADANLLPSFKTPAGHRRFRREDVERFLLPTGDAAGGDAA